MALDSLAAVRKECRDAIGRPRAVKAANEIERLQFVLEAFREALNDIELLTR
jgi:hypothetical protein